MRMVEGPLPHLRSALMLPSQNALEPYLIYWTQCKQQYGSHLEASTHQDVAPIIKDDSREI